jgi:purine-binding chemotaxis protein CheW
VLASGMGSIQQQTEERPEIGVLLFRLADEIYAIPSGSVREVARYRAFTPVPGAPQTLPGILSQRGTILPVVELRPLLGLDVIEPTRATRFVIIAHNEVDMTVVVDAVLDLSGLPADSIEPPPTALDPARARFLRGVTQLDDQPVALIDLDQVIAGLREWS